MSNALLKKTRTKKELKKYYSLNRSRVGSAMNMGTKEIACARQYDRKKAKEGLRKQVQIYM